MTAVDHSIDVHLAESTPETIDGACSIQSVGNVIKSLREERGISARELCNQAQISAMQLWRIEQGKASPTVDTLRKLAGALSVSVVLSVSAVRLFSESSIDNDITPKEEDSRLRSVREQLGELRRDFDKRVSDLDMVLEHDPLRVKPQSGSKSLSSPLWDELPHEQAEYPKFTVICIDAIGRLAEITAIFREARVNIRDFAAMGESDVPRDRRVVIAVSKTKRATLQHVAESLLQVDGVIEVRVTVRAPTKK